MNKSIINELLNSHEINLIEKHLIYSFLQNNGLELSQSPIVSELLADFKPEPEISFLVSTLELKTFRKLS